LNGFLAVNYKDAAPTALKHRQELDSRGVLGFAHLARCGAAII